MKRFILMSAIVFGTYCANAENSVQILNDGFEKGELSTYCGRFSGKYVSLQEKAGVGNSRALVIAKTGDSKKRAIAGLKRFPVEPNCCYTLSFDGKVSGPDTLENNPQLMIFFYDYLRNSKGKPLPGWSITEYDANGKKLPNMRTAFFRAILHDNYFRYTESRYTHRKAAFAEVTFSNNGNNLNDIFIDNVKFEKRPESKVLNINGDFSAGIYDYSGWQNIKNARIEAADNGKFTMNINPKGGIYGDPVPVEPGKKYRVTYKTAVSNKRVHCGLAFMDKNYRQTRTSKQFVRIMPGKDKPGEISFSPAENELYMFPFVKEGVVEYVTVEKISE